jgi:AraC-like DNA-binding protein
MERGVNESYAVPVGYIEHVPPPDLAPWVACFWTALSVAAPAPGAVHRVLPDGCVDIILGFGRAGAPGGELTTAIGVGPMTKPIFIREPGPRLRVAVRFKPGRAYAALGIPAGEIVDENVPYSALSLDAAAELDALSVRASNAERLGALIALVRRRLLTAPAVPTSVRAAVKRIVVAQGNLRIASLASEIGITRQQLARHFSTHVGVSPKMLARVMRTHAVLARMDAARAAYPRAVDWSGIANELGYYDQPHLIDDFKELTGSTPWRFFHAPGPTP